MRGEERKERKAPSSACDIIVNNVEITGSRLVHFAVFYRNLKPTQHTHCNNINSMEE